MTSECALQYYCHVDNACTTGAAVLDIGRHLECAYRMRRPVCTDLVTVLPTSSKCCIWESPDDLIRYRYITEQAEIAMCLFAAECRSHVALSGGWNSALHISHTSLKDLQPLHKHLNS